MSEPNRCGPPSQSTCGRPSAASAPSIAPGSTVSSPSAALVAATSETVVKALETVFEIVKTLITEGPAAAWEKIVETLTNLKQMAMDAIMDYVKSKVVEEAVKKIVSFLSPVVAFIQAIIVGLCLLLASIPFAGVLAVIVLVLGIAQVPALLVTLPAIAYIWMAGDYGTGEATLYTILLFVAGMTDNVLKPLMLGRGVDAPMPVILIGALGGMAVAGILGMFVGATLLALGYQIFMGWVHTNPDALLGKEKRETPAAG